MTALSSKDRDVLLAHLEGRGEREENTILFLKLLLPPSFYRMHFSHVTTTLLRTALDFSG